MPLMLAHDAVDLIDRFGGRPSNVTLDSMPKALIYGLSDAVKPGTVRLVAHALGGANRETG